jgi:hypothetical protein
VVRADSGKSEDRCSLCHTDASCASCHQDEPPGNHTGQWRHRGHTMAASMDREHCAVCHQGDFCDRCHQETAPRNHRGTWGSTRNTHCLTCHFPLKTSEGCTLCHKDIPSHRKGAAKPGWHNAGMNCRQCHGAGVELPHVDKGDDCNACHP